MRILFPSMQILRLWVFCLPQCKVEAVRKRWQNRFVSLQGLTKQIGIIAILAHADTVEMRCTLLGTLLCRYFWYIKQEMEAHLCWGVGCCDFPMTPPRIVALTRQILPEDAMLCLDNGLYKVSQPFCLFSHTMAKPSLLQFRLVVHCFKNCQEKLETACMPYEVVS